MVIVAATASATQELEAVYRQEGDRLWRALVAFAGDPELASEAVAEAFAQALRRGTGINDLPAWVWRAAFRIAAGELKRRPLTVDRIPDRGYLPAIADLDLLHALGKLPDKQRATLILRTYHELSHQQIAEILGSSVGAVKANFFHALANLKKILGQEP